MTNRKGPDFIVVGAHKAGTTSLHNYLKQHPDIYLPQKKGLDLLSAKANQFKVSNAAIEIYLAQFAAAPPDKIWGEVSSVYFHKGEKIAARIKTFFPDVKIIVVLRNPIERAYSAALWGQSFSPQQLNKLTKFVMRSQKRLAAGLYYTHLQTYLSYFEPDQVQVLLYDDLQQHPQQFFKDLYQFIGIKSDFIPDLSRRYHQGQLNIKNVYSQSLQHGHNMNPLLKSLIPQALRTRVRQALSRKSQLPKPPIPLELQQQLADYYRDEIIHLQELTGLECSHWLENTKTASRSSLS